MDLHTRKRKGYHPPTTSSYHTIFNIFFTVNCLIINRPCHSSKTESSKLPVNFSGVMQINCIHTDVINIADIYSNYTASHIFLDINYPIIIISNICYDICITALSKDICTIKNKTNSSYKACVI